MNMMQTEIELVTATAAELDSRQAKVAEIVSEIARLEAWTVEAEQARSAEDQAARQELQRLALETLGRRPAAPWWRKLLQRGAPQPADPALFNATLAAAKMEQRRLRGELEQAEAAVEEAASCAAWLAAAHAVRATNQALAAVAVQAHEAQRLLDAVKPHPILPPLPSVLLDAEHAYTLASVTQASEWARVRNPEFGATTDAVLSALPAA